MTDRVFCRGMIFFGRHGVNPEEQRLGQRFEVDMDCRVDLRPWSLTDEFEDAVSYGDLYEIARGLVEGPPVRMIETLAERIAATVLERFPPVAMVRVEVRKPGAPVPGAFDTVGVEVTRSRAGPGEA